MTAAHKTTNAFASLRYCRLDTVVAFARTWPVLFGAVVYAGGVCTASAVMSNIGSMVVILDGSGFGNARGIVPRLRSGLDRSRFSRGLTASPRAGGKWLYALLAFQLVAAPTLEGQHVIQWWEAALAAGALGGASRFDRGIDDWMQAHRSTRSDAWARAFRHGGQPEVFLTVGGGLLAAGVVTRDAGLRRSGGRVLASLVVAGVTTTAIKMALGRLRPSDARDPYVFRPFSHNESFPSGHTTMAFALAASLSEEIHRPWASLLLYAGATGTGWSRLNDQRHWLSDVLGGAAVGITAAQLVESRWRVFGLRPPSVLAGPRGELRFQWSERF